MAGEAIHVADATEIAAGATFAVLLGGKGIFGVVEGGCRHDEL